jgi:hypothetical protein
VVKGIRGKQGCEGRAIALFYSPGKAGHFFGKVLHHHSPFDCYCGDIF